MLPTALLSLCALALSAYAQLTITTPSADFWWIAGANNTLSWTCKTSNYSSFDVSLSSSNSTALSGNLGLLASEPNSDCSKVVVLPALDAGTGYIISFTNPDNASQVYAQSNSFQVKPMGSAYPVLSSTSSSATGSSTATSTASKASGTSTASASSTSASKNSAASTAARLNEIIGILAVLGGLVAFV